MSAVCGDEVVVLREGLTARLAPYLLVLRLEQEGFRLVLDPDDHLDVLHGDRLSTADIEALRRYRDDVMRLLRYTASDSCRLTGRGAESASATTGGE